MDKVVIEPMGSEEIPTCSALLSKAFFTSPLDVVVFRDNRRGHEAIYRLHLEHVPGQVLLAKDGGQIVGVMKMVEWPNCQLAPLGMLRLLPYTLREVRGAAPRLLKWGSIWAKHDPKQPHWHLGPLAVLPERQGRRIGSQLLERFCEHVDKLGAAAYLETDKAENVRLYERFGFSVSREALVFGLPTWFMWRPALSETN